MSTFVPALGRPMSQSEIGQLLACPQKWSFGYGDVAGFPIEPRVTALRLREGRAWGAAVQEWHTSGAIDAAAGVLLASLDDDAAQMEREGAFDAEEYDETKEKLIGALIHYVATAPKLNLVGSEVELEMHHADGWTYRCHLDGVHQDEDGYLWVVEFKLRSAGNFAPLEQVQLWRQVRWYALALEASKEPDGFDPSFVTTDIVRGVIVDERLNDAPSPVRFNKDGAVSATQSCMLEEYEHACAVRGQAPHPPTLERLGTKIWQQRHEILFRPDELADALAELESAATLVSLYANHTLRPIRVPGKQCATCAYSDLCPTPQDDRLRDALYRPAEGIHAP